MSDANTKQRSEAGKIAQNRIMPKIPIQVGRPFHVWEGMLVGLLFLCALCLLLVLQPAMRTNPAAKWNHWHNQMVAQAGLTPNSPKAQQIRRLSNKSSARLMTGKRTTFPGGNFKFYIFARKVQFPLENGLSASRELTLPPIRDPPGEVQRIA